MEVSEVLNKAADLLEKPGAWTQGAFARDESGKISRVFDEQASCFCVVGALERIGSAAGKPPSYITIRAMDLFSGATRCGPTIGRWNDAPNRTQAEVVEALRQAALRAAATQEAGQ